MSIFTSFIILLYTFFILLDYEAIAKGWIKLVPVKHRDTTIKIVNDVQEGMNKYFRGQAVVAFCVGILFSIGFLIIDFHWQSASDCLSVYSIWYLIYNSLLLSLPYY